MIQIGNKSYTVDELAQFGELFSRWQAASKAETPPHGTGGLFSTPAVRPDMYSRVPRVTNWTKMIPMFPSRNEKEIIEILTGVTAQSGTNQDPGTCSTTPPVAGNLKTCQQVYQFGIFEKATQQINFVTTGHYLNRADIDRRLINPPDFSGNTFIPDVVAGGAMDINTHLGKAYFEFAQGVMLDVAYVDWRGSLSNTGAAAYIGFQREWNGIDRLVKTGYTDAITGAACDGTDSLVVTSNATLSATTVQQISDAYRTNIMNAELSGMPNARWVIAIHPRLKYPLIDVWACNYAIARCLPADNSAARVDLGRITELRDSMLRGNYLLIDGEQVPLVTDAGIEATQVEATGVWTSDVFIIAMDDGMGKPLLFREYLPWTNPDTSKFQASVPDEIRIMNNGLYLVGFLKSGAYCYQHVFHMETRLILDAPFLSARVDNVMFTSSTPFIDPYPNSTYYKDGGTTFRPATPTGLLAS